MIGRSTRRAAVKVLRTKPVRSACSQLYAAQFGVGSRLPGYDSLAYWFATRQPLVAGERLDSVQFTERLFMALVERLRPNVLVEAGAKDAGVAARVKSMLPDVRAVAFEANPFTYERFWTHHATETGVEYLNLALADKPGVVEFLARAGYRGRPIADGKGSLLSRIALERDEHVQVRVPSTTLDEFFEAERGKRVALWVDVEGAAGLVFAGGSHVLRDTSHLIVEVEERPVWNGQALRRDIVRLLRKHGLVPIARDFQSRFQFNLVFVRAGLVRSGELAESLATAALS